MKSRDWEDPVYKRWRAAVKKRDGHKCQMPGCRYKGRVLQVHHIQKWATHPHLRYEISNGITLCYNCHKKVGRHEERYVGLFMRKARANGKK